MLKTNREKSTAMKPCFFLFFIHFHLRLNAPFRYTSSLLGRQNTTTA